jgi:hypothetical protein
MGCISVCILYYIIRTGYTVSSRSRVGRDSAVDIATRYGMDVLGLNPGGGFLAPVQTSPGTHPASYTMCTGSLQGIRRSGRAVNHPPHPQLRLKKIRAIRLAPFWAFMADYRVYFTFQLLLGHVGFSVHMSRVQPLS